MAQPKQPRKISAVLMVAALWLIVVFSAIAVVYVTYDTRVKLNELEVLRREHNQLQMAWSQYLLEESTLTAYSRVEKLAKDKLSMKAPTQENSVIVRIE